MDAYTRRTGSGHPLVPQFSIRLVVGLDHARHTRPARPAGERPGGIRRSEADYARRCAGGVALRRAAVVATRRDDMAIPRATSVVRARDTARVAGAVV